MGGTLPEIEPLGSRESGATGTVELGRLASAFESWPAGTRVAVKRLRPERRGDPRAVAALRAEAQAGASVRCESLVRVLCAGDDAEGPFVVMEYVPGRSLRDELVQSGPLPEPLVRHVGAQIADALDALAKAGLAHGDVKPDNVRLDAEGRSVLVDLGFARRIVAADEECATGAGAGSLPYLSPERTLGAAASPASDVFALGVVLYVAATGRHPFARPAEGSDDSRAEGVLPASGMRAWLARSSSSIDPTEAIDEDEVLAAIGNARFVLPSRHAPQLSPFFDRLAADLLARDPGARPSAAEVAARLREGEGGPWWRSVLSAHPSELPAVSIEPHLAPLVGRSRELARLGDLLEGARGGRGAALWLEGETGSGKRRLVHHFARLARAGADPPLYLYDRCARVREVRPYAALLGLVRRWLHLPEDAVPRDRERVALAERLPPREADTLLSALDPERAVAPEGSVRRALATWLEALGRSGPTLVFLDDLENAGVDTCNALAYLADRLGGTRVLLVLGLESDSEPDQPEAIERLFAKLERAAAAPSGPRFERLVPAPLGPEDVRELVGRLFHPSVPKRRLARALLERSGGNPGLLSELLHELVDLGRAQPVAEDDARLVLTVAPDALPTPRSLATSVGERLDRLEPHERSWLERLAVFGGRTTRERVLAAFPDASEAELDGALARLARLGWLVAAGDRFRFVRDAVRELAWREVPEGRRRALHLAAARALAPATDHDGESGPDDAWQRSWHLREAGEHGELLESVVPLVRRELARGRPQRVHALALWGLDAAAALGRAPADEPALLELLEAAVDTADRLGRRDRQRELLDRLADLDVDADESAGTAARIYLLHGRYAAGVGSYGLARGLLRNAAQLAQRAGERSTESAALRRLALVQGQAGDLEDARRLVRRASRLAEMPVDRALAALARAQLDALADRIEDALAAIVEAMRVLRAERPAVPLGVFALAHMLRARVWRTAGRLDRALSAATRATELAAEAGERRLEAEATARLGAILLALDRVADAEERLRDALFVSEGIEDRRGAVIAGVWLGILLWETGAPDAEARAERATALAEEIGFFRAEAVGCALLARIARFTGRDARAVELARRGEELTERHGAELFDRILASGTHALVLGSSGADPARARAVVASLRRRIARTARRVSNPTLREDVARSSERLLDAVLSPEGPLVPRQSAR